MMPLIVNQVFRQIWLPVNTLTKSQHCRLKPIKTRSLSTESREEIEKAIGSSPVVLFMKGTPDLPQCGFSRASIQILGLQGVDPNKFSAFNVLEDQELRQGRHFSGSYMETIGMLMCCFQASRSIQIGQRYRNSTWIKSLLEVVIFLCRCIKMESCQRCLRKRGCLPSAS